MDIADSTQRFLLLSACALCCKAGPVASLMRHSKLDDICALRRTLKELTLRSDQTDLVFGCSHISQPVLQHLACCPQLRQLTITSAELMAVDLSALSYLTALEVGFILHA